MRAAAAREPAESVEPPQAALGGPSPGQTGRAAAAAGAAGGTAAPTAPLQRKE